MNVVMVTGSDQPQGCGVTHYSLRLVDALRSHGISCDAISLARWTAWSVTGLARRIRSLKPDIIHMQYPTAAYGRSIAPQFLSLLLPMVITIHEVTQPHVLRRLSLYPFGMRSPQIIFTTPYERAYASRWAPWITSQSQVINIGSNIPVVPRSATAADPGIVYFGFLRPRRGLEQVLELGKLLREAGVRERITIVGAAQPRWSAYVSALRARGAGLPVRWETDLSDTSVAHLLARSQIAYLPFPDGASHRRTSLIAALCHGVAVVTTRGTQTPAELTGVVEFVNSPAETLTAVQRLRRDDAGRQLLSANAIRYAERFSWEKIAQEHVHAYDAILDGTQQRCRMDHQAL